MRNYKPSVPFNVAMQLMIPTELKVYGVSKKTWTPGRIFYGSFRTFGGTERVMDDVMTVVDTATIDTWYDTDIKPECQIKILENGKFYDIISDPEDIEMRHQYIQFKVQRAGGKA